MSTYYVGSGGNDANAGTSWALRRLTLASIETLVAAGDTVYVGAGTYREQVTLAASGSAGNLISYIGDYLGANTDKVGGVVRWTGSDNDQSAARTDCINAATRSYRSFSGFLFDTTSTAQNNLLTSCHHITLDSCVFANLLGSGACILVSGTAQNNITVQNCVFYPIRTTAIYFNGGGAAATNNAGHVVQNCFVFGMSGRLVQSDGVGGITLSNCASIGGMASAAISVVLALTVGQTVTVNNCIILRSTTALAAVNVGEITEDYNLLHNNSTDRSNTSTGAHSVGYSPQFDCRWFFQAALLAIKPVTAFDLASYSPLVNLAGTSPSTTDLRGAGGGVREWGALEYNAALPAQAPASLPAIFRPVATASVR